MPSPEYASEIELRPMACQQTVTRSNDVRASELTKDSEAVCVALEKVATSASPTLAEPILEMNGIYDLWTWLDLDRDSNGELLELVLEA